MSAETISLAQSAARRLMKTSVPAALLGADLAGSTDRVEVRLALTRASVVLIGAGWKPRLRVKAGRRVWSF